MAKKAKADAVEEVKGSVDIEKAFEKEFGAGAFVRADQFLDRAKMVIPFAPKIDIALKGGIPEGSTVLCSGQPKTGKTTSTLSFAARCQRPEYGERDVYYFDVEHRLKHMNLNGIKGLNMKKFFIIQSTSEKIYSAEDFLNMAVYVLTTKRNALVIIDSSSALCSSKEQINTVTASARSDGPKLLAAFFRKVGNLVSVTNNILWIMQHLIANTSGFGAAYNEDGGQKAQYQADVKIRIKFSKPWTVGDKEDGKQIGQEINWKIFTSALGGLPNEDAQTYIRYGVGIDDVKEYYELAKSLGIIVQSGSWYYINQEQPDEWKCQGGEKVLDYLNSDEAVFLKIKQQVDELMKE